MRNPLEILQKYWNHSSFLPLQKEIIEAVLAQKNVLALLPTGGGKSICFQIPTLVSNGICLVVSPLIALIENQVKNLQNKGIKAVALTSNLTENEIIIAFDNIKHGNVPFIYISPEKLQSTLIQMKLQQIKIDFIAVDEAHCISEWGHDFRPSYRNIKKIKELQPNANFIALTATATKKVCEDICENLEIKDAVIFKKSFYRKNLAYQIFHTEDKYFKLKQIFTKTKKPAIIYVNTRYKTEKVNAFLHQNGFKSSFYHGGLSNHRKNDALQNWMQEKTPIMVATNAFGMGIDKSNVAIVIHLDLPNSIENYMQEAGRAGRNGKKSFSVILKNENDILQANQKLKKYLPAFEDIKKCYQQLNSHFAIANGELPTQRFNFNLSRFCEKYDLNPIKTKTCIQVLMNIGILFIQQNYYKKSTIQFKVSNIHLLNYLKNKSIKTALIQSILRTYGGVFEQKVPINEYALASKNKITKQQIIMMLEQLQKNNIVDYKQQNSDAEITFLMPKEDYTINYNKKNIACYLQQKKQKLRDVIEFVSNDFICRNKQLLSYFEEKKINNCGICDVCLQNKSTNNQQHKITSILKDKALSLKEISLQTNILETNLLSNLHYLLAENIIAVNAQNKYYLL